MSVRLFACSIRLSWPLFLFFSFRLFLYAAAQRQTATGTMPLFSLMPLFMPLLLPHNAALSGMSAPVPGSPLAERRHTHSAQRRIPPSASLRGERRDNPLAQPAIENQTPTNASRVD